ncbi:shikimate dehydrogenase [Enterococcus cecorum]|uniref:Shikimate dehydrogenase (NADP(+)) n=1 Tax=Enterococcus cecorum TaxID=44008 RepID=A0A1Y3UUK0_9ENTE|nr:shikimate dehydrogenase [Enterococcus cecorum]KLO71000.1 shikimate dehydrogenase [Enterococcus cecorum]OUN50848.1 shikimate dehydrogenase [Enterococcus cecorum]OUZ19158.1 shikimate 5-dehydrogenase [Enterococcus cecorum]CAI3318842.1 shikimate dehydrogenase [Enterococcus cecorum]CAI3337818.1 shikimate dehydrogenase [Enterococcus cecorum]
MKGIEEISGQTRLVGFYANPARHSLSPKMHNLSFSKLGIDAVYLAFEVTKEALPTQIQAIRNMQMLGVNLSMPHKVAALDYVDELSPAAKIIGAINTIVNHEGKLIGHNTDGIGFMVSLAENQIDIIGQTITIIGAGGAATAMITQAALDGVKQIYVLNRPSAHFKTYQEKIQAIMQATNCPIELISLEDQALVYQAVNKSQLLVNATSVGMYPNVDELPIDKEVLRSDLPVYDAIYHPQETKLLKAAAAKGALTINGLGMLLHQGAAAFKLWTNQEMPVDYVKEHLF